MRSPLAAALAVLLACGLAACSSSGPADDGPLSSGNKNGPIPRGSICAPGGFKAQTFGFQEYTNYGHTTVVLDRVVLIDPRNQRMIGSFVLPGPNVIGSVPWPSPSAIRRRWPTRKPVRGFRLAAGRSFNLVLGLAPVTPGRVATSKGILVYYHDSGGSYVAKNYYANIIAAGPKGC